MGKQRKSSSSSFSSVDSSSTYPATLISSTATSSSRRDYLSTDDLINLGLNISPINSSTRDWPPIKPFLRSRVLAAAATNNSNNNKNQNHHRRRETFFVKVYMEGIPIGRKLDLLQHSDYQGLIAKLSQMFPTTTTILTPLADLDLKQASSFNNKNYVLTFEDKDGDLMMVGDVPWELFLTTVKKLKITRVAKC